MSTHAVDQQWTVRYSLQDLLLEQAHAVASTMHVAPQQWMQCRKYTQDALMSVQAQMLGASL